MHFALLFPHVEYTEFSDLTCPWGLWRTLGAAPPVRFHQELGSGVMTSEYGENVSSHVKEMLLAK